MYEIRKRITKIIRELTGNFTLVATLILLFSITGYGQTTTSDTLNCQNGTTTFIIDLSASPDSNWTSPPQSRDGDCCGTDNNCVQFNLTLSPGATGINFTIPSGCGASPSGALFYQVDCGPLTSVGTPLCLTGTGPFNLTFCKPGNNANCYSIESIAAPTTGGDVITADGCTDTLSVTGLDIDSIQWNSIFPGGYADYNGLLSNVAATDFGVDGVSFPGYDTVIVTPGIGSPPVIQYEVCGTVTGYCITETWCDTVSVSIYPTLYADIQPDEAAICAGGAAETLTANPIGGTAPYFYTWSTLVDPAIDGATSQSIDVTIPGEYTVVISDATGCPFGYDTTYVTEYSNNISVNAGLDLTICGTPIPTITLNGSSPVTNTAIWTNYSGTFSTSDTDTIADYTPSAAEIIAGFTELHLFSTNNYTCPGDTDTVIITYAQFTSTLSLVPTHISCFGADDGSIDLTAMGDPFPFTFIWSNSDVSEDISGLSPGLYEVIVTDDNGCVDSIETSIIEPLALELSDTTFSDFNGVNISCNSFNDGSIDLTIIGGSPAYTYAWTTSDGSGLVPTDEDQSGLAAGTYDVTVSDINGCSISHSFTLTEPTALTESTTAFTYPSGDNISCFGLADGSIDLANTDGSPAYSYAWTTVDGSGLVPTDEDQSGLTAGTYDVTVSDINGCTITSSITLTEPTALTESTTAFSYPSSDNISCFGLADGSIDLTNTDGSPAYSYAWTTVDGSGLVPTDEDQSSLTAGTYDVTVTDINGCTITSSITLTEPTALTESTTAFAYPSGDNISCFGLADGSIDLTNTEGSPAYSYAWTTVDGSGLVPTDEDQSGLTAGTYDVTVTDINGCTITSSITLTEPTALTESTIAFTYPSGDNISCFGLADGSIDLTNTDGSPAYSYAWTTVDGSGLVPTDEDQSGLTAGTYDVTVSDINGCTITSSITLTEPTALTESTTAFTYPSGDNISCFGLADGSIDLTNTDGSPAYSYAWTTVDGSGLVPTDEDQSGLTAGTYDVTVSDINGCTITSSITLTEPTALTESTTAFTYPSGDNISCFGLADGSIDLTNTDGSPAYSYAWTTVDGSGLMPTDEDQSGLTAGTYDVTVSDINGCTVTSSITLTEPTALTESTTAFTYPSGDNISCFGLADGSIDLTNTDGSPSYSYAWTTMDGSGLVPTDEDQAGLTAGTYDVTVTDINGCTITSSITLTEPTVLTESTTAFTYPSGDNISCFGLADGSIDLTNTDGSPAYSYAWTTLDGSGLVPTDEDQSGLTAGTYDVTVTDINGCTITSSITLTEPTALTESTAAFTYPSGDNISCFGLADGSIDLTNTDGSPAYSYAWITVDGSGLVPTDEDQSGLTAGIYDVTVTDINGCTITSSITLTEPTALTESTTAFTYPSGDNISCFGLADGSIDLTNTDGSPAYSYAWTTVDGSGLVPTDEDQSGLTAGTYDVTVSDINGCTITSSIILTEPTALTESTTAFTYPSGDNISCFGLADGSIDLTNTDGSPAYSYAWTTVDGSGLVPTDEDQSGLTAGTYDVTVSDINGCTITSSITLIEPTALTESTTAFTYPSGDNISCFGLADGSIDLTNTDGSPAYSYAWTTVDGSGLTPADEDQAGLTAGTYDVTVSDINGCTITSSITLIEPTALTESTTAFTYPSGDNISCFGLADGSIDLTNTDGSPAYSYAWTTVDGSGLTPTDEDQSSLTAGTYDVTVSDINGCTITSSITLTEPTALTESTTAFTYPSGDNISCFGLADGSIDLTNTDGSPAYSYAWTTVDGSGLVPTDEDQSGLTAGTYDVTVSDINGCTITSSITLIEPTELTESTTAFTYPSGDNISCFGLADGSIDLTNTDGSPAYSYAWTTVDGSGLTPTDEDQSSLTAGTYDVTVSDINGCTITSSITLTEPTALTESTTAFTYPSGDNISCFGLADGSIDLTNTDGSPAYSYAWTTVDGSGLVPTDEDQSGLTAGTYDVTVSDINGCTITSSITLTEPTALTESTTAFTYPSGDNISCFGLADGSIDLTNTDGSPAYSYAWTTVDGSGLVPTDEDQSGLTAGTYDVTVSDVNGCSITSSITLIEPTALTESTTAFTYPSGDNISCFGLADGSIDLTNTDGSPSYSYAWTTVDGSGLTPADEDQAGLTAGTYDVTTTDINGCTITSSITLTEPTALTESTTAFTYPSGDNISCFGLADGSIDLTNTNGSPAYSYAWTTVDGSGLVPTDEDQSGLTAGTYDVTVTDINGCTITSSITLTEPTALTESTTAFTYPSGDNISCFGLADGSIDLTNTDGSPAYSYAWTTVDGSGLVPTNEDQSGLTAGTYDVTVSDINGCTITSSITLTEPTALTESTTAFTYPSGDNISCFGLADGSIDLTNTDGSPAYSYAWTTVDGSGLVPTDEDQAGLTAGTYDVTTTDINGCTITSSITLTEPTALTESTTAFTYPSGDNISCFGLADGSIDLTNTNGSPAYSYAWTTVDGSGLVPTDEDQSGLTAGTYDVTVTDINGCTITSSITLTEPTALTESTTAFIYPSGDNISCFGLADGSIDLTNTDGSPAYSYAWTTVDGSGLVPTDEDQSGLTEGTYDVTVSDINGCTVTSSITLTEPTALTESTTAFTYPSGDNISCFGLADGSIDLTNTDGSPAYSYAWTTVDGSGLVPTDEDQSGLTAGTYDVTVTDINGCTITSSITLTEPVGLSTTITPSVYAGGFNITGCNDDGTIDLEVFGGSQPYNCSWSNGSINQDLDSLTEGTYVVAITDENGCTISDSIYLDAAGDLVQSSTSSIFPSGDNISCFGLADGSIDLSVSGGIGPYIYNWHTINGSGLIAADEDQANLTAGTYNVTITDNNGCNEVLTIVLTEPDSLILTTSSTTYASGDNISCFSFNDGSIDLTVGGGSSGYTYDWTTLDGSGISPTNEDQNTITAGTYNVTVNDINGCTIDDSITLIEPSQLSVSLITISDYLGQGVSCAGQMDGSIQAISAGGSPGLVYSWNSYSSDSTSTLTGLGEGTYGISITDTNGCVAIASITLDANPLPTLKSRSSS